MPLVHGQYPPNNPAALLNASALQAGGPNPVRENFPRILVSTDLSALTTQVMLSAALPLQAGDVVTNLTFKSGATAANGPTNYWFALYDTAGALLAQTADQTSTAWAANTAKTLALATAQTIAATGVYYAAVMVKASSAVPSLIGRSVALAGASGAVLSGQKVLAQTSGSSLTATAPTTIATPTTVASVPYVIAN